MSIQPTQTFIINNQIIKIRSFKGTNVHHCDNFSIYPYNTTLKSIVTTCVNNNKYCFVQGSKKSQWYIRKRLNNQSNISETYDELPNYITTKNKNHIFYILDY